MKQSPQRATQIESVSLDHPFPPLVFNLAVAGSFSTSFNHEEVIKHITSIFAQVKNLVLPYNQNCLGFDEKTLDLKILYSPLLGDFPLQTAVGLGYSPYCISPSPSTTQQYQKIDPFLLDSYPLVEFDMPPTLTAKSLREMSHWMVAQCDLVIALWDGSELYGEGSLWEIIRTAAENHIPVVWLDPLHPQQVYWCQDSYSAPFKTEQLVDYLDGTLGLGSKSERQAAAKDLAALFQPGVKHTPFWASFYPHFIRLFPVSSAQPTSDPNLSNSTALPKALQASQKQVDYLQQSFQQADTAAISFNNAYRSTLLLRAILPLLANLALALGFYAKSVGGYLFFNLPLNWVWLAAAGFGMQAFFNLSINWLSNQTDYRGWHKNFVNQRYLAETLRMAVHFSPYNIPIINTTIAGFEKKLPKSSPVRHRIRSIVRAASIHPIHFEQPEIKEAFFTQFLTLLDHQIHYHKLVASRYRKISNILTKTAWGLFWLGIGTVIARAVFQAVEPSLGLNQWIAKHEFYTGAVKVAVDGKTFLASFANMLAMLLPGFAVTFFSIHNLIGFKDLSQRSQQMVNDLQQIKTRVILEQSRPESSFEDFSWLAHQAISLMVSDTTDWYTLISSKKITKN
ncbi:hypothetical protein [Ornatilinea apprima]|nr:hypothetical protein [Ornatilinea apprima]